MANPENTRTQKQDSNQRQPPQQEQQGAKIADKRGKVAEPERRMAPGQSARQPDPGDSGTRH